MSKSGWQSIQRLASSSVQRAPAGIPQRPVDQLARRHRKARMLRAEPLGERADHLMVGAAFARRLDQLRPQQDVLVPAALVDVVVLEEHGRGQHHVGHPPRSRS